jgi:membrane-associated phospholipid phosphatase
MVRDWGHGLWGNIVRSFSGTSLLWHLLAISLTYLLVTSGFDWRYFEASRVAPLLSFGFFTAALGFFVPLFVPVTLYLYGKKRKSRSFANLGAALGQAAILGWLISSFYKACTGRLHPEIAAPLSGIDISRYFSFDPFNSGVFWGWPSSHTTVAFAMAVALIALYPRRRVLAGMVLIYALAIGLGVSVTIHWFSDVIAGGIVGSVVGAVVGESYSRRALHKG